MASNSSRTGAPSLVLREPQAMIVAIPHLLGFTPQRSVVSIITAPSDQGAETIALVARVDLPDAGMDLREYAVAATQPFTRVTDAQRVAVFVIDDAPAIPASAGQLTHTEVAQQMREAIEDWGLPVLDVVYTDLDTYRSYLCTDPTCACVDAPSVASEVRNEVDAEFIAAGSAPLAARDQIARAWNAPASDPWVASLAGGDISATPARLDLAEDASVTDYIEAVVDVAETTVHELTAGTDGVDIERVAPLAQVAVAANSDVHLRDALVWNTAHLNAADQRSLANTCVRLGAAMPLAHREATATLAGVAYYLAGDGVRASIAAEQALRANPQARMADMLDKALSIGLPPALLRSELQSLTPGEAIGLRSAAIATPSAAADATAASAVMTAPTTTAPAV